MDSDGLPVVSLHWARCHRGNSVSHISAARATRTTVVLIIWPAARLRSQIRGAYLHGPAVTTMMRPNHDRRQLQFVFRAGCVSAPRIIVRFEDIYACLSSSCTFIYRPRPIRLSSSRGIAWRSGRNNGEVMFSLRQMLEWLHSNGSSCLDTVFGIQ